MVRSLPFAAVFLLVATPSAATPPPLPPGYAYPPPQWDGLVFTPLPPALSDDLGPPDVLGDVWEMWEVSSWTAVWMRRGRSGLFDGYWTHPNGERVRTTLEIWAEDDRIVAVRSHPDGQSCRYDGRIARDWVNVQGSYTCTWERTPMPWRAQIVRVEEVEPRILRDRR